MQSLVTHLCAGGFPSAKEDGVGLWGGGGVGVTWRVAAEVMVGWVSVRLHAWAEAHATTMGVGGRYFSGVHLMLGTSG